MDRDGARRRGVGTDGERRSCSLSGHTEEHEARADRRRRTDEGAFKRKGAGAKATVAAAAAVAVEVETKGDSDERER